MVRGVVDRRGPRSPKAEAADGGEERLDAGARLAVVGRVEVAGGTRRSSGLPIPTARRRIRLAANRFPEVTSKTIGSSSTLTSGARLGDDDLVPRAAGVDSPACRHADLAEVRSTGEHDAVGVDRPVGGVDADDAAHPWSADR